MLPRLQNALNFAARAHRAQVRKGTDVPYLVHPVTVAWSLRDAGFGDEVVIAGLLHDVTEDAKVPLATVAAEFGDRAAALIAGASEPDKSLPWIARKEHTLHALADGDDDLRALVAADKLDNARSMFADFKAVGDALWSRFNASRHHQAWYYGTIANLILRSAANPATQKLAFELHQTLESLFDPDFSARWQVYPDRRAFVQVTRSEAEQKRADPRRWVLAIDPETLAARFVSRRDDGFVPDVVAHEDLFPVGMLFEHADGFLPGGDWLVATTPDERQHDGLYRSYFIEWTA